MKFHTKPKECRLVIINLKLNLKLNFIFIRIERNYSQNLLFIVLYFVCATKSKTYLTQLL